MKFIPISLNTGKGIFSRFHVKAKRKLHTIYLFLLLDSLTLQVAVKVEFEFGQWVQVLSKPFRLDWKYIYPNLMLYL